METFVIRVWRPAAATDAGAVVAAELSGSHLHGTARHVGSGQWVTFRTADELVRVLGELAIRAPQIPAIDRGASLGP